MIMLVRHLQYSDKNAVLHVSMNMTCQNRPFLRWSDTRCFMIFNIGLKVASHETKTRKSFYTLNLTN